MIKTRFIAMGLVIFMVLIFSTSCSSEKFDATLYNQTKEWVKEDFLKENRVKGYYLNENYVEGVSDVSDKYIKDTESPSSRTFIISNKDEFNRIFSKTQIDVDFEKEIVILYIFSDVNPSRNYNLKEIKQQNTNLTVQIELEKSEKDDSTMLYQRCLVLKMRKVDIDCVEFEKI